MKSSTSWTLFTPDRELNGALAEADLSLEDFKEAHRSVFLGARSSAEGSSRSDRARWRPKFASRHLHRHSWLGVPCSQHVAFASSIVLGTHILLCMLAYYVQWHMLEAWRPLLFSDEELDDKLHQDPVVPAERSSTATKKAATKRTDDGHRVHSFQALLTNLSTIVRNTCRRPAADASEPEFYVDTKPTELQQKALDLIAKIQM